MAELPESIGVFRPETARKILQATQAWERSPATVGSDDTPTGRLPIVFRNNSGHEIPPYGLVQADGLYAGTISHINVIRPFSQSSVSTVPLINGPVAVPDGKFGTAQNGPVYRVKHDGALTYQAGDRLGWKADSFLATLGCLLVVLSADEVLEDCVKVMFDSSTMFGVAAATLTSSTAGNVTVATPYSPVTRMHKAKTKGASVSSGTSVIMYAAAGEWIAMEYC